MKYTKYKDDKSLANIDQVLMLANEVLKTEGMVIKNKNSIPPVVGAALGSTVGAMGVVGVGSGIVGTAGTASFIRTATAIGGGGLLRSAVPIALLSTIGYLIFKNKKDRELHKKKLARYNETIKKQNELIKRFEELDKKRVEYEEKVQRENKRLRDKLEEILAVNKVLLEINDELNQELQRV